MQHEGMVHALHEIRRVLIPNGILIDLRPVLDRWQIEVVSAREMRETGRVLDLEVGLADDIAANAALAEAEAGHLFTREQEEFFSFIYSWDTPKEMEEWLEEEWNDFIGLDEEGKHATRSAWALADGDARVQLRVKMSITRWRKLGR
jgi:SAM-dependent methyltransferase